MQSSRKPDFLIMSKYFLLMMSFSFLSHTLKKYASSVLKYRRWSPKLKVWKIILFKHYANIVHNFILTNNPFQKLFTKNLGVMKHFKGFIKCSLTIKY